MSERDADDGGQELWRQPNGQCQREEQRIERRFGPEDIDRQDNEHHHHHDSREQVAESLDAAFKLGLWRTQLEVLRNLAKHRFLGRLHDEYVGGPATHTRSHEDAVNSLRQAGVGLHLLGLFSTG